MHYSLGHIPIWLHLPRPSHPDRFGLDTILVFRKKYFMRKSVCKEGQSIHEYSQTLSQIVEYHTIIPTMFLDEQKPVDKDWHHQYPAFSHKRCQTLIWLYWSFFTSVDLNKRDENLLSLWLRLYNWGRLAFSQSRWKLSWLGYDRLLIFWLWRRIKACFYDAAGATCDNVLPNDFQCPSMSSLCRILFLIRSFRLRKEVKSRNQQFVSIQVSSI